MENIDKIHQTQRTYVQTDTKGKRGESNWEMEMDVYILLCGSDGKESACNAGDQIQSLGREDPLEKVIGTYSRILAWRIPWTEEPGGLWSMELQGVR